MRARAWSRSTHAHMHSPRTAAPPPSSPPHQLTRRGVREITAERRKQDDEERAAAEAAGPEALAEWMMTQARSEGGRGWGGRRSLSG